jgi:hypothetical protein
MHTAIRSIVLAALLCAVAATPASATKPWGGAEPLTSGANYDRNPALVQDKSNRSLLLFARSQQPCNRLQGCDADNSNYDLYAMAEGRGGRIGAPTLVATNPGPAGLFRGRTVAATRTSDGTIHAFWSSGANAGVLYHLRKGPNDAAFSAPVPVAVVNDGVFNVETVSRGNQVFVYAEECCTPHAIYAYRFAGGLLTDKTLVASGQSIPKAILDKRGTFRMTFTDGDVSVASSADGLHFGAPDEVITAQGGVTNWDPTLAQDESGAYVLGFAPDQGDGRQRIEIAASGNFRDWTGGFPLTPATDGTTKWWDYWPEVSLAGGDRQLFFTSERDAAGTAHGTGHIWAFGAK